MLCKKLTSNILYSFKTILIKLNDTKMHTISKKNIIYSFIIITTYLEN